MITRNVFLINFVTVAIFKVSGLSNCWSYINPAAATWEVSWIAVPKNKPENNFSITLPSNINSATYYLIRHGEAEHNTWKGLNKIMYQTTPMDKFKDTELTKYGVYYGVRAGIMLANSMKEDGRIFNLIYTSDLNRTLLIKTLSVIFVL